MAGILEADMCKEDSPNIQTDAYQLELTPDTTVHRFQLVQGNSVKILFRETEGLQMIHKLKSHAGYVSCAF